MQCARWSDNGSLRVGKEAGTSAYGSGKEAPGVGAHHVRLGAGRSKRGGSGVVLVAGGAVAGRAPAQGEREGRHAPKTCSCYR